MSIFKNEKFQNGLISVGTGILTAVLANKGLNTVRSRYRKSIDGHQEPQEDKTLPNAEDNLENN